MLRSKRVGLRRKNVLRSRLMANGIERLEDRRVFAIAQDLVADINTEANTSIFSADNFTPAGTKVFFTATTPIAGKELWVTDGTAAGTALVKDIAPGASSSYLTGLTNVNGTLFFEASGNLWKSDGTPGGTSLVSDSVYPSALANVNGTLFFSGYDGTTGGALFKSDGTEAGTVRVRDVGSAGEYPSRMVGVGSLVYFRGWDSGSGYELWKSDGTHAGTVRVTDLNPGSYSSNPDYLANLNGTLVFTANDGTSGDELWKSNGTAGGTVLVKDIYVDSYGSYPRGLMVANNTLFFRAADPTYGTELWSSDGTEAGTSQVKDIAVGFSSTPTQLTNVNGTVYFRAQNEEAGQDLWKTNGTEAGTVRVKDLNGGQPLSPTLLVNGNGELYFFGHQPDTGYELWKSDGSSAGTVLIKDAVPGNPYYNYVYQARLVAAGSTIIFRPTSSFTELWASDGTEAGTTAIKDYSAATFGSSPSRLTNVNGTLFFRSEASGQELVKSDGSSANTTPVGTAEETGSSIEEIVNVNGIAYYVAYDSAHGVELWKSDGTAAGTALVKDINTQGNYGYTYSSNPSLLTNVNGTLMFRASDGTNGYELWTSDGTEAGTVRVKDITIGGSGSYPQSLININGTLYFSASDGAGRELWKSDGTLGGTVRVKDLVPGPSSGYPVEITNVNGTIVFAANSATAGKDLWKSDGTAAGTVLIRDSGAPEYYPSWPKNLANVGGVLYFSGWDSASGYELWKSDLTAAGTALVLDIEPGSSYSTPAQFTNVNGTVYFVADLPAGDQLWKTDGTPGGTVLVKDVDPSQLVNFNGTLFFTASDGLLWTSGGTEAGTVLAEHSGLAQRPTDVSNLTVVGNRLMFVGTTDMHGRELFRYNAIAEAFDSPLTTNEDAAATTGDLLGTVIADGPYTLAFDATSVQGGVVTDNGNGTFTYQPVANFFGSDSFTYTITDFDGEQSTATVSITVNPLNDAPTDLAASSSSIAENLASGSTVGTLSTSDVDTGDTFTYTLVSGTGSDDNASFTISGNTLKTAAAFNFEAKSSYSIRVRTTDSGSASFEKILTITVTDVNENPTALNLSSSSIAENLPAGSTVGTFSSTDPDAGNTFTYSLVSGTGSDDNASFTISGNELKTAAGFNFEAKSSYSIRVRTTDNGGKFVAQVFTITVTDENEAPTAVNLSNASIAEDTPSGSTVGTLSSVDPDAGDSFTYLLVAGTGGDDNAAFTIDGNVLKTATTFNFDVKNSYSIRVRSTDAGGLSKAQVFTITITNVNGAPTALNLSPTSIAENQAAGATVGTLSTTDPDASDTFTYTLVAGTGSTNNASFTIAGNTLKAAVGFNFEAKSSYTIRVRSTDAAGSFIEQPFTITVTNTNDAPVLNTSPSPTLPTISEDTTNSTGTLVSSLLGTAVTDQDAGALQGIAVTSAAGANGTWQYTLDGGTNWTSLTAAAGSAAILVPADANARIRFVPKLNFSGTARIWYRAWDQTLGAAGGTLPSTGNTGGSKSLSTAFESADIVVTAVNDAPKLNAGPSPTLFTVNEDATNPAGTPVSSLLGTAVTDPDAGAVKGIAVTSAPTTNGTWQYTLDGGTNWTSLAAASGTSAILVPSNANARIRFIPKPNYAGTSNIFYRAWDQTLGSPGGTLNPTGNTGGDKSLSTTVESASITVTAVNDAPKLNAGPSPALSPVNEDATNPAGTLVSALLGTAVTDPDAGALKGIAVTSAPTTNGTWQYTLDGGTSWTSLAAASGTAAILVPSNANARIRFIPKLNYTGTSNIFYRAWDQTLGSPGGTLNPTGNTGGSKSLSTTVESASITVNAVNDAPTLGGISGTIGYVHDAPTPVALASSATIADVDSTTLNGGMLKIRIGTGANASNRLAFSGVFTIDTATNEVKQGTTVIGTLANVGGIVQDGVGKNLIVTFNSAITTTIARDLIRSTRFSTVGGAAGNRDIFFSLGEADGKTSAEVKKTVAVT